MDSFPIHTITPLLLLITYLSSFKNGKITCDRYLINSFLYLLTSISVYLTTMKIYDDKNIKLENTHKMLASLLLIVFIFIFSSVQNKLMKHILWFIILLLFPLLGKSIYENYDREFIKDILKKMMIIIVICGLIAIQFPQYIKPSMETILIFSLLFVLFFKIMDTLFMKKKFNQMISYVILFIFSGFIIYDTDRILKDSKICSNENADYLDNIVNMFLNLINVFNNLINVMEE